MNNNADSPKRESGYRGVYALVSVIVIGSWGKNCILGPEHKSKGLAFQFEKGKE